MGVTMARMARSSASKKPQRSAVLYDFVPFLVRRVLGWRVGPRGVLLAQENRNGAITIVHRVRDACTSDVVEHRIAQLRPGKGSYQLYWKKGNGRWAAYYDERGDRFLGCLAESLSEISRDPFGCYWS